MTTARLFEMSLKSKNRLIKLSFVLSLLIFLVSPHMSHSQTTVQIGSGSNEDYYFPILSCYNYNYSQQIYLASEITAGGGSPGMEINTLRFYYRYGGEDFSTWQDWTIYLGNTTQSGFTDNSNWIPISTMTQVFNGQIGSLTGYSWMEITLATPFVYTGDNIVVAIDENTPYWSCTALWSVFDSGSGRGLLYFDDYNNPDPNAPPAANYGPSANISQIQFVAGTASCLTPTALTSSDITTNSAAINWTASASNPTEGYDIYYSTSVSVPNAATTPSASVASGATSYNLTGLSAATNYYVWVRANCGAGDLSAWSTPVSFTTISCYEADKCNFTFNLYDSYGDGWNGNSIDIIQAGSFVQNLTLGGGSSGSFTVALCPNLNTNIVFHTGDWIEEASFEILTPWGESIYYGGGFSVYSNNQVVYNWITECVPPTCPKVTNVTGNSITNHTAQITWNETGTASLWDIIYGYNGFDLNTDGVLVQGLTTTQYQLTGLDALTYYDVYVRADCGEGDLSLWRGPYTFTTLIPCPSINSTILTDATYESISIEIEAAGTETEWNVVYGPSGFNFVDGTSVLISENPFTINGLSSDTGYDFYIQAECGADGTSTYYFANYSTTVPCPDVWSVTISNITHQGAEISWSNSSVQDTWNIEVGLPGFIPGTGSQVLSFNSINDNPFVISTGLEPETEYVAYVMADCGALGTSDWVGSDNFTTFPTCMVPVNVVISDVMTNSVNVSWTETGTATTWNLIYGPIGFDPQSEGTFVEGLVETNFLIEGLTANTQYSLYVQADCGGGDISHWSVISSFTTPCDNIGVFPWLEEFTVWSDITNCWDLTGGTRIVQQYGGTAVRANFWSWSSGSTAYLTTPLIDMSDLTNPQVEFYWSHRYQSTYPDDQLSLQVSDDNGANWTEVWMLTGSQFHSGSSAGNTTPGTYVSSGVIDLSSFGDMIYVRFYFVSDHGPDVFINNIGIFDWVCDAPADLSVSSVDNHTASVSWTDVSGEGVADLVYGVSGFDPLTEGNILYDVSNPYTLTNLDAETTYDVYVLSVCDLMGESAWTGPATFTSLANCAQPSNLNTFALAATTVSIGWTDNSGEGVADVLYGIQGFNPETEGTLITNATNPYIITGLTPQTSYSIYVRSVCALTAESVWVGPLDFTTSGVLNNETEILSYSFGPTVDYEPATIDNNAKTVVLYVVEGTDLTNQIATYTLSAGATASIATIPQFSGTTANNFTNGPLTYLVTAEDGTTQNWSVTAMIWVGIDEVSHFDMQILPNPNNGKFILSINHSDDRCRYEMYDISGRIIAAETLTGSGRMVKNFDLDLAPGAYYIRLISGTRITTQKVIIE